MSLQCDSKMMNFPVCITHHHTSPPFTASMIRVKESRLDNPVRNVEILLMGETYFGHILTPYFLFFFLL